MRLVLVCAATLCCFAGNSLLARAALGSGAAGAASFTALRLMSGAAVLWLVSRGRPAAREAGWPSALALFFYAAPFSWAYLHISAGTGALLLFPSVQLAMMAVGVFHGERPAPLQWSGIAVALCGLAILALPGVHAPPPAAAAAMIIAGISWAYYSIRGKRARDPIAATADAFVRSAPLAVAGLAAAFALAPEAAHLTSRGATLALVSGALASGMGYTLWNSILPEITRTTAGVMQLSVPALAAVGGIVLLGERPTTRLLVGGGAILAGIALAVIRPRSRPVAAPPAAATDAGAATGTR